MLASGSAALLAVQLLTLLEGPLVGAPERLPRPEPPAPAAPGEAPSGQSWLVVGAPAPAEPAAARAQ